MAEPGLGFSFHGEGKADSGVDQTFGALQGGSFYAPPATGAGQPPWLWIALAALAVVVLLRR